jgi:hypothetical protein
MAPAARMLVLLPGDLFGALDALSLDSRLRRARFNPLGWNVHRRFGRRRHRDRGTGRLRALAPDFEPRDPVHANRHEGERFIREVLLSGQRLLDCSEPVQHGARPRRERFGQHRLHLVAGGGLSHELDLGACRGHRVGREACIDYDRIGVAVYEDSNQ